MLQKCRKVSGFAEWIVIGIVALCGGLFGLGVHELHKGSQKNTPIPIVQTVSDVKVTQAAVVDLQAKNAADNAARSAQEAATQARLQDAAGYIAGASSEIEADLNPSLNSKIADLLLQSAQADTGPATSVQMRQMAQIIKDESKENADLVSSNENLKSAVLKASQSLKEAQDKTAQIQGEYTAAVAQAKVTLAAKDADISSVVVKSKAALDESEKVKLVQLTAFQRFKAWAYGLGFVTLALAGLVLLAFPILIQAFPLLKPFLTKISNVFLKFWDMLHNEEKKILADAHAEVSKLLAAETAAHTATKAALQTVVSAVAVPQAALPTATQPKT